MEALYMHIANKLEAIRFGRSPASKSIINVAELKSLDLWRAVFAEFLAQIIFVFLGCASTVVITPGGTDTNGYFIKIALAFGLAIMALIQMIGHVSGGHINPAVSIAMAVAMKISILRCLLYVVAQCIGAIIGGYIVKGVTPDSVVTSYGLTSPQGDVTAGQAFGVELILTFCLVTVIFGTTDPNRPSFGSPAVIIGLTVTLGHVVGIQFSGSSMNPSRSLGSAIVADKFTDHWVYWIGPIIGGILSAIVYKYVLNPYRGVINMDEAIERMKTDLPPSQLEDINLKTVE